MTEEFSNPGHEPAPVPKSAEDAAQDHAAATPEPSPSPADLLAEIALGGGPDTSATETESNAVEEGHGEVPESEEGATADESEAVAAVVEEEAGELPESPADLLAEAALGAEPATDSELVTAESAEDSTAGDKPTEEQVPDEAGHGEPATEKQSTPEVPQKATAAPPQAAPPAHEPIKRPDGPENSPFSILVSEVYEGPLDLLLDLIRKQDIDIYDIPIAKITAQFLSYVNRLRASDMDVAGEFIYTASLLIHIKSKMLLPREPKGGDDVQEDPRRELVERLLEHERFKNAAQMLQQKQMLEAATWTNPGAREFRSDAGTEPEIAADTTDLVRMFREILERARSRPVINVQEDSVTVGQMIQFLGRRLTMEDKPVALRRLLANTKSERALIAMFLALLELVRLQAILLRQDQHFSEIFIKKNAGFDSVMNDGMARDDWQ